jgi:hypothetical protein
MVSQVLIELIRRTGRLKGLCNSESTSSELEDYVEEVYKKGQFSANVHRREIRLQVANSVQCTS